MTREEAQARQIEFRRQACPLDVSELWLSLCAKKGRLYERLTSGVEDLKPKKRRRLEQELHETRAVIALLEIFKTEIGNHLESQ